MPTEEKCRYHTFIDFVYSLFKNVFPESLKTAHRIDNNTVFTEYKLTLNVCSLDMVIRFIYCYVENVLKTEISFLTGDVSLVGEYYLITLLEYLQKTYPFAFIKKYRCIHTSNYTTLVELYYNFDYLAGSSLDVPHAFTLIQSIFSLGHAFHMDCNTSNSNLPYETTGIREDINSIVDAFLEHSADTLFPLKVVERTPNIIRLATFRTIFNAPVEKKCNVSKELMFIRTADADTMLDSWMDEWQVNFVFSHTASCQNYPDFTMASLTYMLETLALLTGIEHTVNFGTGLILTSQVPLEVCRAWH